MPDIEPKVGQLWKLHDCGTVVEITRHQPSLPELDQREEFFYEGQNRAKWVTAEQLNAYAELREGKR